MSDTKKVESPASVAQRIEQTRPKGEMGVQFPSGALTGLINHLMFYVEPMADFLLEIGDFKFEGEFRDNATARLFYDQLPLASEIKFHKEDIYFSQPLPGVKFQDEDVELTEGMLGYVIELDEVVILRGTSWDNDWEVNWFAKLVGEMNALDDVKEGEMVYCGG